MKMRMGGTRLLIDWLIDWEAVKKEKKKKIQKEE